MEERLGNALAEFNAALLRLRARLDAAPPLREAVLADADEWISLLHYKLLPHFEGEGCLVAAVAGGTNTGKSTVFNMLLGEDISPVRNTAAATSRPVLAGSTRRYAECLGGKLVPEFQAEALGDPEAVIRGTSAPETLFAVQSDMLPDRLVLLDTPDVDSIDRQNWAVAENIRAAGDVLVAVLTGEKYKDERVVEFFRRARRAGRLILPLMNKADPDKDFDVARRQLADFCQDTGCDGPALFAVAHDFAIARDFRGRKIHPLTQALPLHEYLEQLDVEQIKKNVYRDTVTHFAECAAAFLVRAREEGARLRQVVQSFDAQAHAVALQYAPAPGAAVGGLFHEFVQAKRGRLDQVIGSASRAVARGISAVGRSVTGALLRRATFEKPAHEIDEGELRTAHRERLESLARGLAASYYELAQNLREPLDALARQGLETLDLEAAIERIIRDTLQAEDVSLAFRQHAQRQLDLWWNEHPMRRQAIMALDKLLLLAPAAIASAMAVHTGGVGVAEAMVVAGPVAEQFAARAVEFQFGDRLFDFISPWQQE
ncbi:MAG: 50S ribosome-binding GTPase, partial [Candidatus Hydrogenedentes bacterium]|nr:50S ribosome-binding GTPase [Candidatus Hydrogenedentota bacterium]